MKKTIKLVGILLLVFLITGCKKHKHELIHVNQKKATCMETGIVEHWKCETCEKYFLDELGKTETQDILIKKLEHSWIDATCTKPKTCTMCDSTEGQSLGHNLTHYEKLDPTCTEKGHTAYDTCSRCDYTTYEALVALGHNLTHHEKLDPTCTEKGHTAYDTCSRCDYTTYEVLVALGHNYDTSNIKWKWGENNEEAVAILTCKNDANHQERVNAGITKEEKDGIVSFTATITYNNVEYIDRKTITFDPELEYMLSEGATSYIVAGIGTYTDTAITIPSMYNQLPVTSIGVWAFSRCSSLTSIVIPNSVTSIEKGAFYYCSNLTSITIPNSVTSIGENAFWGCSSLTNVTLGNSLTSIEKGAFYGCSSLTSITIPNSVTSIGENAFWGCSSLRYNEYGNGYYLGNEENPYAVLIEAKDTSITTAVIHNDTRVIYSDAFSGCGSLVSIAIPDSVTSIGDSAFFKCTSLTSMTLGNSLISIGWDAFEGCTSLISITIPNSVTTIKDSAFYRCISLTSIVVEKDNPIYDSREDCNAIIETATNTLIVGCQNSIIPNGVKSIKTRAFEYCSSLTSITISNSVTSIGSYAFSNCSSLTSIVIPNSVTSIGENAFAHCTNLTRITIPNSVTSIGKNAFFYCLRLYEIMNNSDLIFALGSYSYGGIAYYAKRIIDKTGNIIEDENSKLIITEDNFVFFYEKGIYILKSYIGQENTITLPTDISGCEYVIDRFHTPIKSLSIIVSSGVKNIGDYAFYECNGLTSIVIPNSVTSIGNSAFSRCSSLTSIVIPDSVTSIGGSAFWYCSSLTSIVIPDSVTSIGGSAFYKCSSLTSIVIPNNVTSIGESAFEDCSSLTSIIVDKNNSTYDSRDNCNAIIETTTNTLILGCQNTIIPNSVTSIGESAFEDCFNLTSIVIPDSVTSIGLMAFSGCRNLISIVIPNSVTSIGKYAFSSCSSLQYNEFGNCYYLGNEANPYLVLIEAKDTSITNAVTHNNTKIIYPDAFSDCGSLKSITISNNVACIGQQAFYSCSSLTNITIPNSVTSIGEDAFWGCSSLQYNKYGNCYYLGNKENLYMVLIKAKDTSMSTEVIHNDTRFIYSDAFSYCSSLTSITISNNVISIQEDAFADCRQLTNVYYGGTMEDWCKIQFESFTSNPLYRAQHFYMKDINNEYIEVTEIKIPDTITCIGKYQFYSFDNITSIVIPNSVTWIGDYAFNGCSSLTSITVPNSVTSIRFRAFGSCSSLTNVYYDGTIEDWCKIKFEGYFADSHSNPMDYAQHIYMKDINEEYIEVTEIEIPNTITCIGNYQFYGFNNITSIKIPNSVTWIGDYAFLGCSSLTSIVIPNSVISIGENAFKDCSSLTSIVVEKDNPIYDSRENCNAIIETSTNTLIVGCQNTIIPNSVTCVGDFAFSGCSSLISMVIPNSVTSIGTRAFEYCSSLTSITIPNSVISIGQHAFSDCSSLTIYCEANAKPSGWDSEWNYPKRTVVWGYKQSDDENV